ncbi:ATP-binding cassette domain-containing protein, partial [[Pasteurella] aerogenes]
MSVLTEENLTTKYSHEAILNGLNLTIDDNEILCLLGAKGCGKTTLLKAIAGLQPISQGKIILQHQNPTLSLTNTCPCHRPLNGRTQRSRYPKKKKKDNKRGTKGQTRNT